VNRSLLLFVPLLAACGSVVIVPGDPRADAAAPDAAVLDGTVPGDAVTPPPPPPPDVTVVDATPPPPPPPPPPQTLARACQTFCMRGNAVCRTTADCATLCRNALSQSGVMQCPAEALALITCGTNRNGFVCRPGSNSFDLDRMLCSAESMAFDRCQSTPPPPPPPPPDPLREICARVCERQARDCGTASSGCVEQCASVAAAPNYDRCSAQVLAVYTCAARVGFTCGPMGMNQLPAACRPAAETAQTCLNGPTEPPPPPDDGGVAPLYRACVDACAVADRACGMSDPACATDCSSTAAMLRGACLRTFDELMTCVQRNGFTCMGGSPQPSSVCNPILTRLEMCAGGGGGGAPPTVDAGAPDA
jgi:hypothetical protein